MSVAIFVPEVPDFVPLLAAAEGRDDLEIVPATQGYWQIRSPGTLELHRKLLGLRTALWFSMLGGGVEGKVTQYTHDCVVIEG
jgi:hypothetical protein